MTVEYVLLAGRMAAELNMLDTCRVTKPGVGQGTWNDTTGQYDPPAGVTVYTGPCKVQVSESLRVGDAEAGEVTLAVTAVALHLPIVGSENVTVGMDAEILTAVFDTALVGARLHIKGPHKGSQKTARRLACEVVS